MNLEKIIEEEGYGEKWAREKLKEEEMRHAMDNDHVLENGYDDEVINKITHSNLQS